MEKQKGITLIALVITIIVLLIVAGVAVNTILGENGILRQAKKSSLLTKIKEVEEQARISYSAMKIDEIINQKEATFAKVISDLKLKGYEIEQKVDGNIVEGIVLSSNAMTMPINDIQKLAYTIYSKEGTARYFVKIEEKYYEIVMEEKEISVLTEPANLETISGLPIQKEVLLEAEPTDIIETKITEGEEIEVTTKEVTGNVMLTVSCEGKTAICSITINAPARELIVSENKVEIGSGNRTKVDVTVNPTNTTDEIKWESANENVATVSQSGEITGVTIGVTTITVSCGKLSRSIEVNVIAIKPTEEMVADTKYDFKTPYGKIDIIWLSGTSNTVAQTPNVPILTANNESMTPVKWDNNNNLVETKKTDSAWYHYSSVEEGDNTASKWANAKTKNNSYFVWIPRYAYRITYYEDEAKEKPVGYYDGYGMWRASDGNIAYRLEGSIETVDYEGEKYIVHSAFQTIQQYGGWKDTKLAGFWVAKFEVVSENSELKSMYGLSSRSDVTVGNVYLNARKAKYGFNGTTGTDSNVSYMNSHLIKNSEWGAVAYLAYSKFGRNTTKITINGTYITGGGKEEAYKENGAQSTTGNLYGVYDLSGGNSEYVAAYNSYATETTLQVGSWTIENGLGKTVTNQFVNQYENSSDNWNNPRSTGGVSGDAAKEIVISGNTKSTLSWEGSPCGLAYRTNPFLVRGGDGSRDGKSSGIFYMNGASGKTYGNGQKFGFRTVLVP